MSKMQLDIINNIDQTNYEQLPYIANIFEHINQVASAIPNLEILKEGQLYRLSMPNGVAGSLMEYKNGDLGTPILNNGKITGHAGIAPVNAMVLNVFSILSITTGQFFLTQINSNLSSINQKMDDIIEFLYSDKRAELLSELNFIKKVYHNYSIIMNNDVQRTAVLGNILESNKTAIKNIEFFTEDLKTICTKPYNNASQLNKAVDKIVKRVYKNIELAAQLYIMSIALEVYYSQNFDEKYLEWNKNSLLELNTKCNNDVILGLSSLNQQIINYKNTPINSIDKTKLQSQLQPLLEVNHNNQTLLKQNKAIELFDNIASPCEITINKDNIIYYKRL